MTHVILLVVLKFDSRKSQFLGKNLCSAIKQKQSLARISCRRITYQYFEQTLSANIYNVLGPGRLYLNVNLIRRPIARNTFFSKKPPPIMGHSYVFRRNRLMARCVYVNRCRGSTVVGQPARFTLSFFPFTRPRHETVYFKPDVEFSISSCFTQNGFTMDINPTLDRNDT